jgi:hypothetical protein
MRIVTKHCPAGWRGRAVKMVLDLPVIIRARNIDDLTSP